MTFNNIEFGIENSVATIVLNRPERLNALDPATLGELGAALDAAVAGDARAVLLSGAGRAFCSGADLLGGEASLPEDLGGLLAAHYNPLVLKFAESPIPIVTAVHGAAAGAGCSIALLGDFVVAARSAYFLLAFVNIGLVPDAGATWLVAKGAGRAKALEMMLLGERVPAEKAESWGLIHKVVDDETLLDEARALAGRLTSAPTRAIGMIRRAVGDALAGTLEETLATEAANQRTAGRSADFQAGVQAFREKRKPVFTGR